MPEKRHVLTTLSPDSRAALQATQSRGVTAVLLSKLCATNSAVTLSQTFNIQGAWRTRRTACGMDYDERHAPTDAALPEAV